MLTYPSDPLPQIVCPMDEDAISPNLFCSAPPHSEPPPPLPPFSSITPSCANDGISGHGRSGRIQGTAAQSPKEQSRTDGGSAEKPSRQNPSPPRGQKGSVGMVPESNQPAVEGTPVTEIQSKDGCDLCFTAECQNDRLEKCKTPRKNTDVFTSDNVVQVSDLNAVQSNVDTCGTLPVGDDNISTSEPKGWLVGPLFQSFKSKMASFTEIIKTPVKLLVAKNPPPSVAHLNCELRADEPFLAEQSTARNILHPEALGETGNQGAKKVLGDYAEELVLSTQSSERADERTTSQSEANLPDSVPLRVVVPEAVPLAVGSVLPFVLLQPIVVKSASHTYKLRRTKTKHKYELLEPLQRKPTRYRKKVLAEPVKSDVTKKEKVVDELLSLVDSVQSNHSGDGDETISLPLSVCHNQPNQDYGRKMDDRLLVPLSLRDNAKDVENEPDRLPESKTYLAARLGRAKRQMNLQDHFLVPVKRNKVTVDVFKMEYKKPESGLRPPWKKVSTDADGEESLGAAGTRQAAASGENQGRRGREMLIRQSESCCDPVEACSLEKRNGGSEDNNVGCSMLEPSGLDYPEGMALETTIAITSTKGAEDEQLSEAFIDPDVKPVQNTRKGRDVKRKQASSNSESLGCTSSVAPPGVTTTRTSQQLHTEDGKRMEPMQPSKRPKKGGRGDVKALTANRSQEMEQSVPVLHSMTKETQPEGDDGKLSAGSLHLDEVQNEAHGKDNVEDEAIPTESSNVEISRLRRRVGNKSSQADKERRTSRVLSRSMCEREEVTTSVAVDNMAQVTRSSKNHSLSCLLRSYSCPEIPSFRSFHSFDLPLNTSRSSQHCTAPTSHQSRFTHSVSHQSHKSLRRTRRHTVCSMEVMREIAPLCLRKEVFPSRRSLPYDCFGQHLSPSLSLSPLASRFLSSPLAFLSKKVDSSTPGHDSPPPPPAAATSTSSGMALEREIGSEKEEEEQDVENRSSCRQEFEDAALIEEKALSDSEVKVVQKHEERGKVSSIRIRRTLPKPLNNLTPMGLPKPIRLKKKEFSLEEIYTNKNFTKPPESRLETIFEVPLNRRNGSESWFGQRRFKRFLEFSEARKPKKSLVGVGKAGKLSSRTRRGGSPKEEPSTSVQDVDSLLCSKLDQLSLWLMHDQTES